MVWLVVRDGGEPESQPAPSAGNVAVEASVQDLRDLSAAIGRPVYWAGRRRGTRYELRQTADGRTYVRYLPRNVAIGDPRPAFLTIGTYRVADAYAVTRAAGRQPGATTLRIRNDGIAIVNRTRPSNVYLAYRGSDRQVEVFHPSPAEARRLVTSNRIRPVR